jgi:hypothetical protein
MRSQFATRKLLTTHARHHLFRTLEQMVSELTQAKHLDMLQHGQQNRK